MRGRNYASNWQSRAICKTNQISKGQIWCVYDKDSFPTQDFNGVVTRVNRLNEENLELKQHVALNVSSFSLFYILLIIYQTITRQSTYLY